MSGRSPRRGLALATLLAVVACLSAPAGAAAQDGPAGAVTASGLATVHPDVGASVLVDVYWPIDVFRVGGFFGAGAIPSLEDERNRVFAPFGVSLAIDLVFDPIGVSVRARGGMWGGATQEEKLTAGAFFGGGAYLTYHLGEGVTLGVGMDVWAILGAGETAVFAPGITLTFGPAPAAVVSEGNER